MNILSVAEVRHQEERYIGGDLLRGYFLMCRAGHALASTLAVSQKQLGFQRIVFLAGPGNNGGDALCAARELFGRIPLSLHLVKELSALTGEAALAASDLPEDLRSQVKYELEESDLQAGDLVIDGLLGIGYAGGNLRGTVRKWIELVNASRLPVLALDVPSGMNADTGKVDDIAVKAQATLMFGWVKAGLLAPEALNFTGALRLLQLPAPDGKNASGAKAYTEVEALADLPVMPQDIHKNRKARVMILAGCSAYGGAARLNAMGAFRTGLAGLVRLASCAVQGTLPDAVIFRHLDFEEANVFPADAYDRCRDWEKASNVLVCGSGWGQCEAKTLGDVWEFPGVLVLDADALNTLARHQEVWKKREQLAVTPHYQEAVRLSEAFGVEVLDDPVLWAKALADKLHAVVILKGPHTVTASFDGECWINTSGSNRLATAGSGDVLAGIVGAAAGCPGEIALGRKCAFAVWLHGMAGELLSYGGIADDLGELLPKIQTQLFRRGVLTLGR